MPSCLLRLRFVLLVGSMAVFFAVMTLAAMFFFPRTNREANALPAFTNQVIDDALSVCSTYHLLQTARAESLDTTLAPVTNPALTSPVYKVIGWNDLGMHCMNESFANLAVLPPYNTMWAQVILQGPTPQIITTGVTVQYSFVDNTFSACQGGRCKTNFWDYANALFGVTLAPNVGLTGATLSGTMFTKSDHFVIEGVPLTPYRDSAPVYTSTFWYPYQQAHLVARDSTSGQVLADTMIVAPVSTEMRCSACHFDGNIGGIATGNVETNILVLHDGESSTNLINRRPVLCASCHASNALGLPGNPELPSLSLAIHSAHAEDTNNCYLCHPGQTTQCLRDVMYQRGVTCQQCHGNMGDQMQIWNLSNPNRQPWIDLPRCQTCHGAQYAENAGKRYRDSIGHGGMYCEACHGSPHAILPTIQPNDNLQNIALQGRAGTLKDCRVCHGQYPTGAGPHGLAASINTLPQYLPVISK